MKPFTKATMIIMNGLFAMAVLLGQSAHSQHTTGSILLTIPVQQVEAMRKGSIIFAQVQANAEIHLNGTATGTVHICIEGEAPTRFHVVGGDPAFDEKGVIVALSLQLENSRTGELSTATLEPAAADDNEPGLPGVIIYSDVNLNGRFEARDVAIQDLECVKDGIR